jgi:phosphatidylinositol alpha-1,6-mannosyltransferase
MKLLLIPTQDYLHHPNPSRQHYIFEELATRHEVHVPHFHVSRGPARRTRLVVHEATAFPLQSPLLHYTLNAPEQYRVISGIIRDEGIEAVSVSHILAGTAAIRAAGKHHIPVLFDLSDWFPDSAAAYYENHLLKRLIRDTVWQITRHNLAASDLITTISPSMQALLKERGFPSTIVTNGVDTDYFRPLDGSGMRRHLGIGADEFVIGYAGVMEHWYDLDGLIEAMPRILAFNPRTRLLMVGGSIFTRYRDDLEEKAAAMGLADRVIFTGNVPYREMPGFISAMDVCTIPLAPPDWMGFPNKYFEYSACGKPILARPIRDVMAIGGEHLSIYRDTDEYVNTVRDLIERPRRYEIDVSAWSWKQKAVEMEALLAGLISDNTE